MSTTLYGDAVSRRTKTSDSGQVIDQIIGHSDWAKTYQRIPRLLDESLTKLGAQRLVPLGETDAKVRDMFSDFETWEDGILWPAVEKKLNIKMSHDDPMDRLKVSISTPRTSILRQDVTEGLVVGARKLTTGDVGEEKRHLEIQLPNGLTYAAGDYLAVLPHNPKATVARVMRRLHLAWDAHVSIEAAGSTTLPTNASLPVSDLLSSYVELGQVATRRVSGKDPVHILHSSLLTTNEGHGKTRQVSRRHRRESQVGIHGHRRVRRGGPRQTALCARHLGGISLCYDTISRLPLASAAHARTPIVSTSFFKRR